MIFTDKSEITDLKKNTSIKIKNYSLVKDLPEIGSFEYIKSKIQKSSKKLKIIFLSRIAPEKNLHLALEIISELKVPFIFDIYGPIGDYEYWGKCKSIIER